MVDLEDLSIVGNGIISLVGIEEKFPNLAVLDISHNKIFSVLNVDVLRSLPHLAEVNFQGNPICVHRE
jgi:Leucine-rich repeat (LRR) protein